MYGVQVHSFNSHSLHFISDFSLWCCYKSEASKEPTKHTYLLGNTHYPSRGN